MSTSGTDVLTGRGGGTAGSRGPAVRPARHVFPGRADQVARARGFVQGVLGGGCPAAGEAALLASELVTNALLHTRSGAGGTFEVVVWCGATAATVAVIDDGADTAPAVNDDPASPQWRYGARGRGLFLVNELSARWGHRGGPSRRIVWFRLTWPPQ